ncbi:Acyltransferase-like protein [Camellia lanceoleosa]|uniref:Acyltransferase-like protein n=1 Tax=Camellia lanceoleosa TaxID=1840588 RepID=A0ACC0IYK4_9ERIC|nr:Acyltransferase-like protein [Camellia lanceoleosa]
MTKHHLNVLNFYLVKFVEEIVRLEHASFPNKPIYLVGNSFGGCLALAIAAHNPTINLVVILANPASSFGWSQLLPLFPLLEAMPNELHITVPYLLSFVMGICSVALKKIIYIPNIFVT